MHRGNMSDSECSNVEDGNENEEDIEVSIGSETPEDDKLAEFEKLLEAIMESRCPSPDDGDEEGAGTKAKRKGIKSFSPVTACTFPFSHLTPFISPIHIPTYASSKLSKGR